MAKQLKVDFAELTDIGRRRSVNQDNLAQRVPEDPQEVERNGALFVVADGMGGHAAGEIASTIAVNTICSAYFDNPSGDVLQGLAQAIKQANDAILSIARENTDHAGMGTTLVAAVLCQGILYVANIGDSRAYIIRHGRLRQLTEDHSWVAEQVRAGVLTEDQARSHVHRNVITRSLGTQSNVTADVFVEPAREGDILILCSDGLHGYVNDELLAATTKTYEPVEAARRLIDLANEAGGPDNITVTIIRVSEMPEASVELLARLQLLKDQPRPTKPLSVLAGTAERTPISAPEPPSPLATAPTKAVLPRKRRRTGAVLVRLVAMLMLIALSFASWKFVLIPFVTTRNATTRLNSDLAQVQRDLGSLAALTAPQQLSVLARDQQLLQNDEKLKLTQAQRTQIQSTLDDKITPATRLALTTYDAQSHIVPLTTSGASLLPTPCAASLLAPLVSIPGVVPTALLLYARTQTNQLVPLTPNNGSVTCGTPLAANVTALASLGSTIELLAGTGGTTPTSVQALDAKGALTTVLTLPANVDVAYTNIAVSPNGFALAKHDQAKNVDSIVIYAGAKLSIAIPVEIALPQPAKSIGYGANGLLYILLNDGSLATLAPAQQAIHLVGDLQIAPALPINDPQSYTSETPVPTLTPPSVGLASDPAAVPSSVLAALAVPADTAQDGLFLAAHPTATSTPAPTATPSPPPLTGPSTAIPTASTLAVDNGPVPHVAITDGKGHRVIELQSSGVDLQLVQQYVDASQLDHLAALTFAPDGHTLFLLVDNGIIQISLP